VEGPGASPREGGADWRADHEGFMAVLGKLLLDMTLIIELLLLIIPKPVGR
jgi:hypothetical protein